MLREPRDHRFHRLYRSGGRTEIPASRIRGCVGTKAARELQVACKGFKHVLPWPHRGGIANHRPLSAVRCASEIGYQTIARPIATSDDVTRTRRREARSRRGLFKEGLAEGRAHELRARLAAAVRVESAKRIVFAITPDPVAILVTLIGGSDHDRPNA